MPRLALASAIFLLMGGVVTFGLASSCSDSDGGSDSKDQDETTAPSNSPEGGPPPSRPGELAVGGLPDAATLDGAQELTSEEAALAAASINSANQALPLELAIDTAGTSLRLQDDQQDDQQDEDGGADGLIGIAALFGDIYDTVTGGAGCAFNLLTKDAQGAEVPLQQVADRPIYYADGWTSIGFGDEGEASCPERAVVDAWVQQLFAGVEPGEDEEGFFPARVVLFKNRDGQVWWNLVYMPKDYLATLAAENEFFAPYAALAGDYSIYRGTHGEGGDVGQSKGIVTLDFDSLGAMINAFADVDAQQAAQTGATAAALTQTDEGEDGPFKGKITVTYDMVSTPQEFTTNFTPDFDFGDGGNPFDPRVTVVNRRAGDERYLAYVTTDTFGQPNPEDPEDTGLPVLFCDQRPFGEAREDDAPLIPINYIDVPQDRYLERPSVTYLQLVWRPPAAGQPVREYGIRSTSLRGGPYIFGPVRFEAYAKADSRLNAIKVQAPLCDTMTPAKIAEGNQAFKDYFADNNFYPPEQIADFSFVDEDGVQYILFDGFPGSEPEGATEPFYATEAAVAAYKPSWTYFGFVDKAAEADAAETD